MSGTPFVGRQYAACRLEAVLQGKELASGKLSVLSVEGPGGIGKTFLLDHVLSRVDVQARRYLLLRIDGGAGEGSTRLFTSADRLVGSARSARVSEKPAGYFFTRSKRTLERIEAVRLAVLEELTAKVGSDTEVRSIFSRLVDVALVSGKAVNDVAPRSRSYLDARQLEVWTRLGLESLVRNARAGHAVSRWLGGILPDWLGVARANAVKTDAGKTLADALVADLTDLLSGYRWHDVLKPRHAKLREADRLLLILDDYEGLMQQWSHFLTEGLLPGLRQAGFESVVLILGRDQLTNTHTEWDQHLRSCLLEPVVLGAFTPEEVRCLAAEKGIKEQPELERAWGDTQGFPYYLQLWLEEVESGGRTFTMLKRFYDRTTRWMSEREKGWLEVVVFLESVNRSTLRAMLGDEGQAGDIFDWFEKEASIREVTSPEPRLREYVRSRLRDYLTHRDPERRAELSRKAEAISTRR